MATSSKRAYATCCVTQVCCTQSSCLCGRPLLTHTSVGDTQTLKGRSGSVSVGSLGTDVQKILFEPSKCLWQVWGLILNAIPPLLPSCRGLSFALGQGVSFFGGIQHSPVDGCSSVSPEGTHEEPGSVFPNQTLEVPPGSGSTCRCKETLKALPPSIQTNYCLCHLQVLWGYLPVQ